MELRAELRPPVLDEALVRRLGRLAAELDGARTDRSDALVARFNEDAGTSFEFRDFHGIYGVCDHETWVRSVLFIPSIRKVPDITFDELVELTGRVLTTNGREDEITFWVNLLTANVPEKRISDLIFWPGEYFGDGNNQREMSAEEIVRLALTVKTG